MGRKVAGLVCVGSSRAYPQPGERLYNGTGIPDDIKDKLFQPFFTTKPTGEGTWLGLAITYDIVIQQHGGTIAVDSKVGEFSEFTIRLPHSP